MKRFALVGLSILCLSLAATTSVKAGTRTERISMTTATIVNNPAVKTKITPFALVSLAYQGEYRTQGIPGFGLFQFGTSNQTITAKDLIKAAIDANQLSPDAQTDRGYLNAIEQQLSVTDN
jgi:carbon starvation protein CstA